MATTKINLNIQSDKVLSQPTVQDRVACKDAGSVNTLFIDFDEPAGADRTINFADPGADDAVAYLDASQVFQNKQISTVPVALNDITNKTYVDGAVSAATPDATAGSGGAVKGIVTFDSDKGLDVVAGIAEVKVDGVSITFDGFGQLQGGAAPPTATAAPGGGTIGKVGFDSLKGLDVVAGIAEVKVDATTIGFTGGGNLEVLTAPGITIRSEYLSDGSFGNIVGAGVTGDIQYFNAGDFETFYKKAATVGAGSIHLSFQGRLGAEQTTIQEIRYFVKGTAATSYTLKVYVEGFGLALTVGPAAPPLGSTEVVKTAADLEGATPGSSVPGGSKRFAVLFETTFSGAAQDIYISRPFTRVG